MEVHTLCPIVRLHMLHPYSVSNNIKYIIVIIVIIYIIIIICTVMLSATHMLYCKCCYT